MGKYNRCSCGRLFKDYNRSYWGSDNINIYICPKCNKDLDEEYEQQERADRSIKEE